MTQGRAWLRGRPCPSAEARSGRCLSVRVTCGAWLKRGASGSPVPLSRSSLRPVLFGASGVRCLAQTRRFGVAHAPSPDAHFGHRGLRSLGACFAHGSWLRSHPTPALGARATPRFQRRAGCITAALCLCGAMSLCRAIDRPPGWRPPRRRAEPAQAKTVRMLRVEPISLPTGRPDGGASMSGRSPPKRKRAGCSCFA